MGGSTQEIARCRMPSPMPSPIASTFANDALSEEELRALISWLRRKASNKLRSWTRKDILQTTVLVNEAMIKLLNGRTFERNNARAYYYAAASRAVREAFATLVRTANTEKRGARIQRVSLCADVADPRQSVDFADLHEAIEALSQRNQRASSVVDLKFYAGLTISEIAELLDVSESTVESDWREARRFLLRFLKSN